MRRGTIGILFLVLLIFSAKAGWAQFACAEFGFLYENPGVGVALSNLPDGSGFSFDQARLMIPPYLGFDATLQVTVRNDFCDPIPNFPAVDIWILPVPDEEDQFYACTNGAIPDGDTDWNGQTVWYEPLHAGGYTEPGVDRIQLYVALIPLYGSTLDLQFNSGDVSGDGQVNLSDIGQFSQDFYGSYAFRSDFVYDEILNLSDVGVLAQGNGVVCD